MWLAIDYVISVAGFREVRMVGKVKTPGEEMETKGMAKVAE